MTKHTQKELNAAMERIAREDAEERKHPSPTQWKEVSEARYMEMLEILPPALWNASGFLVGEPTSARECRVTKQFSRTWQAFFQWPQGNGRSEGQDHGRYFEACEALTPAEFRAVKLADVLHSLEPIAA